ncbi:hypothetical protein IWQ57_000960, partial [Coemansia nantahalensis]
DRPEPEAELKKRWDGLVRAFEDHDAAMALDDLVSALNLDDEYDSYFESCPDLFSELAKAAPALVFKTLPPQPAQDPDAPEYRFRRARRSNENVVVSNFFALYRYMSAAASTVYEAPKPPYLLQDHQSAPIRGTDHKPDGVLYYQRSILDMAAVHLVVVVAKMPSMPMTISHPDFGRVADYACAMWEAQPTRMFAPVIFLHGEYASLVLFTRGKWYTVALGCLLHQQQGPTGSHINMVRAAMMDLWFLFTLTPDKFGHFCDIRRAATPIRFTHTAGTVMATARVPKRAGEPGVDMENRIPRPVLPRSRCTYLHKTSYNGKPAVLKLAWTQMNRLPESAVYDILVAKGVAGIPEVYDSGLLKTDFFGLRLEYLVLEDCGDRLDVCLDKLATSGADNKALAEQLSSVVEVVAGCVVAANAAGVLHRDVSLGNVAVSNGQARLLDWGGGKVVESSDIVEEMAERWMFDAQEVMEVEADYDPITGTVRYMGIRMLLAAKTRGYLDDIESLFYVVLHAISLLENGLDTCVGEGNQLLDCSDLARVRLDILRLESNYHEHFGISKYRDSFCSTLDAMHKFLFWSPAGYTGYQLVHNMEYDRPVDMEVAAKFMNEGSLEMLGRIISGSDAGPGEPTGQAARLARTSDNAPQPRATKRITSEPMMTRAAAKKAKAAGKKTGPANKENDA